MALALFYHSRFLACLPTSTLNAITGIYPQPKIILPANGLQPGHNTFTVDIRGIY
jgi:hypothetical protein